MKGKPHDMVLYYYLSATWEKSIATMVWKYVGDQEL